MPVKVIFVKGGKSVQPLVRRAKDRDDDFAIKPLAMRKDPNPDK